MAEQFFISQGKLESLVEEGKVSFADDVLTLAEAGQSFRLAPAVKVLGLVDGADDAGLVGQMRTVADIEAIGGEHFSGSLIVGETAYECEDGFLGFRQDLPTPVSADPPAPAPDAPPLESSDKSDSDMLAEFMLKHL